MRRFHGLGKADGMIDTEPPTDDSRQSSAGSPSPERPAARAAAAEPSDEEVRALLERSDFSGGGNLIGILQDVQERFGYLPASALEEISRRAGTPLSRIYGVVSFYAQFYTSPRGRHTVRCCRGTACYVRGGKKVLQTIQKLLGIKDGETTEDMMFSFETVACLGACALSPMMVVDSAYYGKTTPRRAEEVLDRIIAAESAGQEAK
jgi:NADH-quinone oxidoreductase subunit E